MVAPSIKIGRLSTKEQVQGRPHPRAIELVYVPTPSSEVLARICSGRRRRRLSGFHHLGYEGCAELLREIEECYQRYEADPDWVPYLDSLFENVITGEVAACDI